ncbi:MAG: hypothetical protein RR233_09560, partial [Clostridiales bacterium]
MKRNIRAGGASLDGFSLNVLGEDSLYKIHLDTLELLERTGVFVEIEKDMDVYQAHGCHVNRD